MDGWDDNVGLGPKKQPTANRLMDQNMLWNISTNLCNSYVVCSGGCRVCEDLGQSELKGYKWRKGGLFGVMNDGFTGPACFR